MTNPRSASGYSQFFPTSFARDAGRTSCSRSAGATRPCVVRAEARPPAFLRGNHPEPEPTPNAFKRIQIVDNLAGALSPGILCFEFGRRRACGLIIAKKSKICFWGVPIQRAEYGRPPVRSRTFGWLAVIQGFADVNLGGGP